MFYFKNFPKTSFGQSSVYTDIKFRFEILPRVIQNESWFDTIELNEGENLETIAFKLYGSPAYTWVILLSHREHPLFANFKQERELLDYCKTKYSVQLYDVHHYEHANGEILDEVDTYYENFRNYRFQNSDVIPITNKDYESRLNYSRRLIKVLKPEYLNQLLSELNTLIKQATS